MTLEWWPLILVAFLVPPFFIWYVFNGHHEDGSRNTARLAVQSIAVFAIIAFLVINWGSITTVITPPKAPTATNGTTNTTTPGPTPSGGQNDLNNTTKVLSSLLAALIPLIVIIFVFGTVLGMLTGRHGIFGRLGDDDVGQSIGSSLVHDDEPDTDEETERTTSKAPEPPQPKKAPVEYNRLIRPRGVCRFCSGDVYTDELQCPHCGAPAHEAFPQGAT